jgi:integrase
MMIDLLSPSQYLTLQKGENMKPFITSATRATCSGCGGTRFEKKRNGDFVNEVPICVSCKGRPRLFRIGFSIPNVGGKGFKKIFKTTDEKGRKLDSASRADAFCEYVKSKISLNADDFDPRELGTQDEQNSFIVKYNHVLYFKHLQNRVKKNELTPGGYVNIEKIFRLYIVPLFGDYSVKDINYQLVNQILRNKLVRKKDNSEVELSDSVKRTILTYMNTYHCWCVEEGLIKTVPILPKRPKGNKAKKGNLYTIAQRDLVINNIINANCKLKDPVKLEDQKRRYRIIQIAIMIEAAYANRDGEVIPLKWGNINFKNRTITIDAHLSDDRGLLDPKKNKKDTRSVIEGLKSSPEAKLVYSFFPGLYGLLMELGPSLNPEKLLFEGKDGGYLARNATYDAWARSAKDLVDRDILPFYVDLHRGVRTSTLNDLRKKGHSVESVAGLHGGDQKTVEDFYINEGHEFRNEEMLKHSSSFIIH